MNKPKQEIQEIKYPADEETSMTAPSPPAFEPSPQETPCADSILYHIQTPCISLIPLPEEYQRQIMQAFTRVWSFFKESLGFAYTPVLTVLIHFEKKMAIENSDFIYKESVNPSFAPLLDQLITFCQEILSEEEWETLQAHGEDLTPFQRYEQFCLQLRQKIFFWPPDWIGKVSQKISELSGGGLLISEDISAAQWVSSSFNSMDIEGVNELVIKKIFRLLVQITHHPQIKELYKEIMEKCPDDTISLDDDETYFDEICNDLLDIMDKPGFEAFNKRIKDAFLKTTDADIQRYRTLILLQKGVDRLKNLVLNSFERTNQRVELILAPIQDFGYFISAYWRRYEAKSSFHYQRLVEILKGHPDLLLCDMPFVVLNLPTIGEEYKSLQFDEHQALSAIVGRIIAHEHGHALVRHGLPLNQASEISFQTQFELDKFRYHPKNRHIEEGLAAEFEYLFLNSLRPELPPLLYKHLIKTYWEGLNQKGKEIRDNPYLGKHLLDQYFAEQKRFIFQEQCAELSNLIIAWKNTPQMVAEKLKQYHDRIQTDPARFIYENPIYQQDCKLWQN